MKPASLHIINLPLAHYAAKPNTLIGENDALLVCRDGCFDLPQITATVHCPIYVLKTDAHARGVTAHPNTQFIDDDAWVKLVLNYRNSITW